MSQVLRFAHVFHIPKIIKYKILTITQQIHNNNALAILHNCEWLQRASHTICYDYECLQIIIDNLYKKWPANRYYKIARSHVSELNISDTRVKQEILHIALISGINTSKLDKRNCVSWYTIQQFTQGRDACQLAQCTRIEIEHQREMCTMLNSRHSGPYVQTFQTVHAVEAKTCNSNFCNTKCSQPWCEAGALPHQMNESEISARTVHRLSLLTKDSCCTAQIELHGALSILEITAWPWRL